MKTLLALHALPPEYKDRRDDYVSMIVDELIPRAARDRLATSVDAFCEQISDKLPHRNVVVEDREDMALIVSLAPLAMQKRMGADQLQQQPEIAPEPHRDRRDQLS